MRTFGDPGAARQVVESYDAALAGELGQSLRANDRGGLTVAIESAAARVDVARIRFPLQVNTFVQHVLQELGLGALEAELARLRDDDPDAAAELTRRRDALRRTVRTFVERRLALAAPGEALWSDDNLTRRPLWTLDRREVERMRTIVRAMAKRLATRYGRDRRHRRRGHLDVRRTLRRNTGHGGVPFVTVWKRRRIEHPRVLALCDVGGSVAPVAQFLLLFLHSLARALSDIRSFAFSGRLIEVSETLAREPIDDAVATIVREIGLRSSDYGRSLVDFADGWLDRVDRRTSIVIMGDARSNDADPRTDILKMLYERSKRVVWLNPEPRSSWGSGDSEMLHYLPYCHVAAHFRTARDLERIISRLLTH